MNPATRCLVWGVLPLLACGPVDGRIFSDESSADTDPLTTGSSLECHGGGPLFIEGNDARFSHDCGESCDSDWCFCEPCRSVFGPLARLRAGQHRLDVSVAASGDARFSVGLLLESGERLFDEAFDFPNAAESRTIDFDVPSDCAVVYVEWRQESRVCSRVYDLRIDPAEP